MREIGLKMATVSAPGQLDVRLFGHLEVAVDGVPVRLATPRKTLQVLAYLWLHRGGAVSREYLAFLLYPDDEEGAARAKLRATLSELPKILPRPAERYVVMDGDKISWNPQTALRLDVDAFAEASADRRRAGEAIELYRGDLLPEIYDEWFDTIRERHRNAYLRCLNERISQARRNADLALAIETARKVLAIDPWREDVVRRIIAMRYESGDRAGALREYAAFAQRLLEEMGVRPMAETAAVAERISRDEAPQDDAPEDERPLDAGSSAMLPFVGRRDEMERLLEIWSRTAGGRGACAFVGGEAGIGKSRLVLEFARAVEDRGGRVLAGTTGAPEAVPYESIVEAMRSALPLVASLKPSIALACVATLLPELHARVALPDVPRLEGESERIRLFESIFRSLASLAAPRPLLLVLEDLHRAQAASLELLAYLLRRVSGLPLMIVVTYREEESAYLKSLHRLRREARATAGAQSLWLSRLSVSDLEELRAALPDARERTAESLAAASQGNPLFLAQIVADAGEGAGATTPASLQEAVMRRVERLSERARTAAEIAACIGDRFSHDTLREASAWDDAELSEALDELFDRRIVCAAGGRGFLEYAFTHNLVHDLIEGSVPPKDAAIRRRRIARVLEELYPERFSELSAALAAHYECAGDAANASRCYLEAVRRSIAIGALDEARTLCERALQLALDARLRVELLIEKVTIESRHGTSASRGAALLSLEHADRELGDPEFHRQTLLQRIEFAALVTDLQSQAAAVRELAESLPEGDTAWRAAAHLAEAKLQLTHGELGQAVAKGEAALASSRAADDEAGAARALCFLAKLEGFRGNLTAAGALLDEAAQVAMRAADPALELLAVGSSWVVSYQRRDMERCRTLARRCVELAVKLGDRPAEAQALGRLGIAMVASEALIAEARRKFAEAARAHGDNGDKIGAAAQFMNQAVLEAKIGFFDRAIQATDQAIELFSRAGDERGRLGGLANRIYISACLLDAPAARKAAEEGLGDARRQGFGLLEASMLENLAMAEGAVGNYRRAIELADESFGVRSRSESLVWSSATLAASAIWLANVGDLPAALDAVARLLADDDAIMRGADWPTYCYWAAAQVLHFAGKSREAARQLERAKTILQSGAGVLEPEDHERYLALPFNVDILNAAESDVWPDPPR